MKTIKFTATIIYDSKTEFGKDIYTGWMNEMKGIIAQGESIEEVEQELLKILRISLEIKRRGKKSNVEYANEYNVNKCYFREFEFKLTSE